MLVARDRRATIGRGRCRRLDGHALPLSVGWSEFLTLIPILGQAPGTCGRAIRYDRRMWRLPQIARIRRGQRIPAPGDRSLFYDFWSVIFIPSADRLNRSPWVCECSLITTPLSFLRYATEPPAPIVAPAVTAE